MKGPSANKTLQVGQAFSPYQVFTGSFIPEAISQYKGLSPGAKIVYGRLVRYAGKNGKAYPSFPTLAVEVGLSARQTFTYVRQLEVEGFIALDRSRKTSRSNCYRFLWHVAFTGVVGKCRKEPCRKLRPCRKLQAHLADNCKSEPLQITARKESHSSLRESSTDGRSAKSDAKPAGRPSEGWDSIIFRKKAIRTYLLQSFSNPMGPDDVVLDPLATLISTEALFDQFRKACEGVTPRKGWKVFVAIAKQCVDRGPVPKQAAVPKTGGGGYSEAAKEFARSYRAKRGRNA